MLAFVSFDQVGENIQVFLCSLVSILLKQPIDGIRCEPQVGVVSNVNKWELFHQLEVGVR